MQFHHLVVLASLLLSVLLVASCDITSVSSSLTEAEEATTAHERDINNKHYINLKGVPQTHHHFNQIWDPKHDYATIFVGIASFRDVECPPCVRDAFKRALNSRRVVLGIIEQNEHGDPNCIPNEYFKCNNADFCPIDNIRRRRVAARRGKGPTYGRYVSMLMYRGENYYMMIDSHNEFVRDWDRRSILQVFRARSPRPVMSHYPNGWDKNGQSYESQGQAMVMCKGIFVSQGYVRNGARWMPRHPEPRIQPFTAAGYLFADARLVHEVPFDPYLDFIFDGEELLYTARLFTRGWDPHTPGDNIVFHDYNRHNAPRYWGTQGRLGGNMNAEISQTHQRAQLILKVLEKKADGSFAPMVDVSKIDKKSRVVRQLQIYGLGDDRTIEQLYEMGAVDMKKRHAAESYCDSLNRLDRKFSDAPVR